MAVLDGHSEYDVVVVGGGHNGLVAAGYLAKAGLRVIVLERRHVVGGPCGPVEYFPGFRAAMSNSPGSLEPKIVADLELEQHGLRFAKPDPSLFLPFGGKSRIAGWRDRERTLSEIRRFSVKDAVAYPKFNEYLEQFAKVLNVSIFEPPPSYRELFNRLQAPADEETFGKLVFGSVADLLAEWFEADEIKAMISTLAVMSNMVGPSTPGTPLRLLQRPMSLTSSTITAAHDPRRQELRGSTGLPEGGMGSITNSMARSLLSRGGEIRTDSAVTALRVDNKGVHAAILADGQEVVGRLFLSNLNPKTTLVDLVDGKYLEAGFKQRLENLVMRGSQFKVGLALDGLPRWAAADSDEEARLFAGCQFRIAPSMEYLERAYDDAKYGFGSQKPVIWGLIPSVSDPSLVPPGKHLMSLNVYHAPYKLKSGAWSEEREKFGKRCIDVMTEFMPDLKDRITDTRYWSPEDIEAEFGLVEANITHGDIVPGNMFSLRPMNDLSSYRTPISGLYLCGSAMWPGGYVSGVPGHNASQQVLADIRSGIAYAQTGT